MSCVRCHHPRIAHERDGENIGCHTPVVEDDFGATVCRCPHYVQPAGPLLRLLLKLTSR